MRQADAVPEHGIGGELRLELEDLEHRAARHANPPDPAAPLLALDAEERADAVRIRLGDADQRAAEDVPVEAHGGVEIRHRDAAVAERSCSHRNSVVLM